MEKKPLKSFLKVKVVFLNLRKRKIKMLKFTFLNFTICSNGMTKKNINKTSTVKKLEKKLKREQRKLSRKYESLKKRNKNIKKRRRKCYSSKYPRTNS